VHTTIGDVTTTELLTAAYRCLGFCNKADSLRLYEDSVHCHYFDSSAAADLGMFSMFGRTGAPTKRGPTKAAVFLHAGKMGDRRAQSEKESDEQKRSPVFEEK